MKLGRFVQVSIAVQELAQSLLYFERLGFEKLDQSWEPWPWAVVTDGLMSFNLSQSPPGAPVLNYFASDMKERVDSLEKAGVSLTRIQQRELPELLAGLSTPAGIGVSMLEYPARRIPRPPGVSSCKCGEFVELAFPVPDLEISEPFWARLGFEKKAGGRLPYPWAVLDDGLIRLGLYQTGDFSQAALAYQSQDLPARIELLENEGFRFAGEIPNPRNAGGRTLLETPDRLVFFLEYRNRPA